VRLFVAIGLTDELLAALRSVRDRLDQAIEPGAVRWVRPGGIHLTLKFLGEVRDSGLGEVEALLEQAARAGQPFELRVGGFGCFPSMRKPRVLWVGVEEPSGALERLQSRLERGFVDMGFRRDRHDFHPHLTLGRVKRHVRGQALRELAEYLTEVEIAPLGSQGVQRVQLIRSELRPEGARYTTLSSYPFGGVS
jgi:2'-5' RNA ligase